MIICQTLWTNRKSLLENSFGWRTPQHHIMCWALSALKLVKHHKNLFLYTDRSGKDLLINELGLPNDSVFDDYEDLDCPSYLWAMPKLLTYSRQEKPFLHVDGDVIIWKPFDRNLLSAELIAQNLEKGTAYYKDLFSPLIKELNFVPQILHRNIANNIMSYNAGIIGGSDLFFFKRMVSLALELINRNIDRNLNHNFNMIFEQLLFYSLAKKEKKKVTCYLEKAFDDNGYSHGDFADFTSADRLGYLHLIGTHKFNKENCDWLARCLRQENEDIFLKIVSLFKTQHYFYSDRLKEIYPEIEPGLSNKFHFTKTLFFAKSLNSNLNVSTNIQLSRYVTKCGNSILTELYKYECKLKRLCAKFKKINFLHLKNLEEISLRSISFFSSQHDKKLSTFLYRNPYIEIIESAFDWTSLYFTQPKHVTIRCEEMKNIKIAIIPEIFFSGYRELVLDDICINILVIAAESLSFNDLMVKVRELLPRSENAQVENELSDIILSKTIFLLKNKLLFID